MSSKSNLNHDGLLSLEQPLVKVPIEQLKRAVRNTQKYIEREITALNAELAKPTSDIPLIVNRLKTLKRKLEVTKAEEELYSTRAKQRINHLVELTSIQQADSDEFAQWSKVRLDRLLVDYMLRKGYIDSALNMAQESNIQSLVDIELFRQSKKIEDALHKRSCTECLQWCNENKSALKKIKSNLEFNLRIQEFVEIVRENQIKSAIAYAKKYLAPFSEVYMKEIQQATALLAFTAKTDCQVYKKFFDETKWKVLVVQFRKNCYQLNNLTPQPMLRLTLQAGLSALKTQHCYVPSDKNVNCPCCESETYSKLAEKLPMSHHVNSCIVCRISGEIINEDNPPMVLPNGFVYSQAALKGMAEKNAGSVTCPRSGSVFLYSLCRKAFIS